MAFNFSEAGKYYNPFTFHYLKSRILALTQARKFDILYELQQLLKTAIPEIIDISPDHMTQIQIQQVDNIIKTNLNTIHLKSISFDLLGDLKLFKGGLDPKYSINVNDKSLVL